MITNGTLQYKTTTGGGISEAGDTIPVIEEWSEPIDCLLFPNSSGKLLKYQDGEFVAASYSIHLELDDFEYTSIRITDNRGFCFGEFQVLRQNIYHYTLVNRVKLIEIGRAHV